MLICKEILKDIWGGGKMPVKPPEVGEILGGQKSIFRNMTEAVEEGGVHTTGCKLSKYRYSLMDKRRL